jgi:hypothetical protein
MAENLEGRILPLWRLTVGYSVFIRPPQNTSWGAAVITGAENEAEAERAALGLNREKLDALGWPASGSPEPLAHADHLLVIRDGEAPDTARPNLADGSSIADVGKAKGKSAAPADKGPPRAKGGHHA